jgi:hypothetical protein
MSNPFQQHRSALFAERESIDAALHYVHEIIGTLTGADKAAALTAMMVLVNTAAKVWPEADAPVQPEAGASELSLVRADLDARLAALADRVAVLEVTPVTPEALEKGIEAWADEQFNTLADLWLRDHADLDNEIETWAENNLDIEGEVQDVLRSASLRINF